MIEYTHGGWMPPQQPSASWRAMIQSVQRRSAARLARAGIRGSTLCSALSRVLNATDQASFWSALGGRPGTAAYSSSMVNGSGLLGLKLRHDRERDDRLPGPAAPVVDVQREPGRQVDDLGRDHRQRVPRPQAGQREPHPGEHAGRGERRRSPVIHPAARPSCAARPAGRPPAAARRTPRPWWTGHRGRRRSWPTCRPPAAASGSRPRSPSGRSRSRMPRKCRAARPRRPSSRWSRARRSTSRAGPAGRAGGRGRRQRGRGDLPQVAAGRATGLDLLQGRSWRPPPQVPRVGALRTAVVIASALPDPSPTTTGGR